MHNIPDHRIGLAEQKIPQRHRPHQSPLFVQYIADIDRLAVHPHLTDSFYGILYGNILFQIHIFHCHNASGTVFGIPEKMVDIPSCFRAGIGQQLFDNVGGHFLQQVRCIICHQVINDTGGLFVGQCRNNKLLIFHFQIGKHIGSAGFWQYPEHLQQFRLIQAFNKRRNICIVYFRQTLS